MSPQGLERARDRAWSIGASERGIGSRTFEFSPLENAGIVMDPSRLRASPAKQLGLLEEGTAGTLRHEAMHNVLYSLDRNTQRALAELPEVQKAGMEALTDKYGVRGTFTYIANQTTGPLHEVALKITNTIPGGIRKLEDAPPEFFEGLSLLQPRLNSPSAVRAFVADVMNASSRVRETMMQELFAIAAENNSMRHIPDAVPQELREELGQVISLINSKLR